MFKRVQHRSPVKSVLFLGNDGFEAWMFQTPSRENCCNRASFSIDAASRKRSVGDIHPKAQDVIERPFFQELRTTVAWSQPWRPVRCAATEVGLFALWQYFDCNGIGACPLGLIHNCWGNILVMIVFIVEKADLFRNFGDCRKNEQPAPNFQFQLRMFRWPISVLSTTNQPGIIGPAL